MLRRAKTNVYGERYIYLKDGEYALIYNALSKRYSTCQHAPQHFKLVFTNNEELVDIFTSYEHMHETKKNLESLNQVMES